MSKTLVSKENLFTHKLGLRNFVLTLNKETYSDGSSFYSLVDYYGNSKVERASNNLNDLIEQLVREQNEYDKASKSEVNREYQEVQNNFKLINEWYNKIITNMKGLLV